MMGRRRNHFPIDPRPEWFTAIIDSREQTPVAITGMKTKVAGLETGDYSVEGMENEIVVERKSGPDLVACCAAERPRFERELRRMTGIACKALVIESTWEEIERAEWRSQISAASVIGSLLGWAALGIPLIMCGTHERAGVYISRFLFIAARRRWREVHGMIAGVLDATEAEAKDQVDGKAGA